jgi:hypothetical protein
MRRQDWITALVELLIVVLGIFIALQVVAWSTKRLDIRDERIALERLLAESVNAAGYLSAPLMTMYRRMEGST